MPSSKHFTYINSFTYHNNPTIGRFIKSFTTQDKTEAQIG